MSSSSTGPVIGIVGGGQLGRMLVRKAGQLGFDTVVLDPMPGSPAGQLATQQIVASLDDDAALGKLAHMCDVTTYEIEHIAVAPLKQALADGALITPTPSVLALIQDKLAQKQFFATHALPTSPFVAMDEPTIASVREFGTRAVQKLRFGGYDGQGVAVLSDTPSESELLAGPSLLEAFIDAQMEIAVVVARRANGQCSAFPAVEMRFDANNVLDILIAPARIEAKVAAEARELALATVAALDGVGVFGVEMLLDEAGHLYINEVAPRVHNSGHFTIEACRTCQFEQHLRAITDLPLGDPTQHSPAVMVNVLGEPGSAGATQVEGLCQVMDIPGVSVHMYAKAQSRPGRKMGHLTVVADDLELAIARAERAKAVFKVRGASQT